MFKLNFYFKIYACDNLIAKWDKIKGIWVMRMVYNGKLEFYFSSYQENHGFEKKKRKINQMEFIGVLDKIIMFSVP